MLIEAEIGYLAYPGRGVTVHPGKTNHYLLRRAIDIKIDEKFDCLTVEKFDCPISGSFRISDVHLPDVFAVRSRALVTMAAPGLVDQPIVDRQAQQFEKQQYQEKLKEKFNQLIFQWHKECGATSSITKVISCPAYLRIIAMGPDVIPLILRQLESEGDEPDFWFWALQLLTGANPVPQDAQGDMKRIAEIWLDWARRYEYAW